MFQAHRTALMEQMSDAAAIFFAAPETIRNNDVHHEYRQASDFHYLTGFEESEAVLVVAPHRDEEKVVLFLRERDPEHEVWDGELLGVERAPERLGVDAAFPIETLAEKLPELLHGAGRVYYSLGADRANDEVVLAALRGARRARKKGVRTPSDVLDPAHVLHELRLVKGSDEIEAMRAAGQLNAEAHRRAMAVTRPGLHEYQLQAAMEYVWRMGGSPRNAYPSIVGSGPNACVLHYRDNRRAMQAGDLVLVDAGCELNYYASDVTRTWPVSGRFTEPQKAIYEVVLASQKAAIEHCRPGNTFESVHERALEVLVTGMVELGLVEGPVSEAIEEERYKPYYMHRTSHWIGMDVHDVGAYHVDGESRPLEPGMVLTVEPGIYVADDADDAPEKFRGIGVRIEDDVLVTEGDPEELSEGIPKEVDAIESLVGTATGKA